MNVQDLIDELQRIKDKTRPVKIYNADVDEWVYVVFPDKFVEGFVGIS